LETIHEIFDDLPAVTELVPMLQRSQAGDLAFESAQFNLLIFEDSGNSQSEDDDWVNDKELENI